MKKIIIKFPFVQESLLKKVNLIHINGKLDSFPPLNKLKNAPQGKEFIKGDLDTWSRASTILPTFVGLTFKVHNGKKLIPLEIKEEIVGYKLGEFALTRRRGLDSKIKKKK